MIELILTKELLYATLVSILMFSVFRRFNFMIVNPPEEQMKNVDYKYHKDFNVHAKCSH